MMTDLRRGVWSELTARQPIDIYRRNLQKSYVETVNRLINPETNSGGLTISFGPATPTLSSRTSDAISIAKAQLRTLQTEIRTALPLYKDASSRAHLQDVLDRITQALDPNK
jgi:hypothetical protein